MFEFRGYINGDTMYIEVRYNGVVIDTKLFSSNFKPSIDGVSYSGIDGAIRSIKFEILMHDKPFYYSDSTQIIYPFTSFSDTPANTPNTNTINATENTIPTPVVNSVVASGTTSGITSGNTVKLGTDELKKNIDGIKDGMTKLQGLGLPGIKDVTNKLWKYIEEKLLTKRQIAKKILMIATPEMTAENAQLFIYGKLYYKNGVLFDDDVADPSCVSKPTDHKYYPPLSETHPISKQIDKWIKELKDSLNQLGIKLGEFIGLIADTIETIVLALTSLVSSLVILPFGAGMPTALTAVKSMMIAIKNLQAKIGEIFPFLSSFDILGYLLETTILEGVLLTINGILSTIKTIIDSITSIFGILDVITSLFNKIKRRSSRVPFKATAIATPDHVKINQTSTLSVNANGGDYNYTFEWIDSYGNVIINDNSLDYDDGTRTLTPYIPHVNRTLMTPRSDISNYTVKVTDGTGRFTTSTVQIIRI